MLTIRTSILCALSLASSPGLDAADSPLPKVGEVLQRLGFKAADEARLLAGEMLSNDPKESSDKELALTVVAFMPADLPSIAALVREHKVHKADDTILQEGVFGAHPSAEDLKALSFTKEEAAVLNDLVQAKAGSEFNLSTPELEQLQAVRRQLAGRSPKSDPKAASTVLEAYRTLLVKRVQAYAADGLGGISPYDRGDGKQAMPATELKGALEMDFVVVRAAQGFLKALEQFPKQQPDGLESQLFWMKQEVDKRPCLVLAHNLIEVQPTHAYMAQRQVYVGHSYNSLQILVGCLPVEKGTVVFYRNRTFTDQVAGFGSAMRKKIGEGLMRKAVLNRFEAIRSMLK